VPLDRMMEKLKELKVPMSPQQLNAFGGSPPQ
jgi:hypothetical protein